MPLEGLTSPEGRPFSFVLFSVVRFLERAYPNKKTKNRDVTDYLQLLLRKSGYRFTTTAEKEIVRTLKEKVCVVSQDLRKDLRDSSKPVDFTLPDGNIIKVSQLFLMVLLHLFVCFLTFLLFCPDW